MSLIERSRRITLGVSNSARSLNAGVPMSVPILVCECGMRVRAPGATPGRVGRCPQCGRRLEAPAPGELKLVPVEEPTDPVEVESRPGDGYLLGSESHPAGGRSQVATPSPEPPRRAAPKPPRSHAPMADGILPTLERPEDWWLPSLLYPLRGAESLAMVAILGTAFWVSTVLIPEYCLGLWRDANALGTPSMGMLVILITVLPVVIALALAFIYWLQYLGRVLVASASGDTSPPRTPDRNFDGLLSGLGPWFLWLLLGGVIGLGPLAAYRLLAGDDSWDLRIGLALVVLGLPYAQMALMLTFLHDDDFAATPGRVLGAIFQLNVAYLSTCLINAAAIVVVAAGFAGALALRPHLFGLYVLAGLASCFLLVWVSIVVMRILGNLYYRHRKDLRWHRKRPRWGVTWGL